MILPFSVHDVQLALAKVIPIMNGLVNTICADAPNQFIQVTAGWYFETLISISNVTWKLAVAEEKKGDFGDFTSFQELLLKEQVKDFAANIYEAFSQPDSQHSII